MKRLTRNFNDRVFAEYYMNRHRKTARRIGRQYAAKLLDRGFSSGRILDAGCGFGGMAVEVAALLPEADITGIDVSGPLLHHALESVTARESVTALESVIASGNGCGMPDNTGTSIGQRVRFEEMNVEHIRFDDNSFDVVLCIALVHLVDDPIAMLGEIDRVLKPDGLLFISDLRRSWLGLFEHEVKSALKYEEAVELLQRARLRAGSFSSDPLWWRYVSEGPSADQQKKRDDTCHVGT